MQFRNLTARLNFLASLAMTIVGIHGCVGFAHLTSRSILRQRNIRRVWSLHADDVITGIDVMHLAGDAARQV